MRCIISFLLTFTVLVANARQISQKEAQSIASEFFNSGPMSVVNNGPHRVVQTSRTGESVTESQPYYIFNAADNAGFVIISGDTRAKKILGYSDKGNIDSSNVPPQLDWLLGEYEKQMAALSSSASLDESWQTEAIPSKTVLLETANWGQGYPYNAKCPVIEGVQAPTGCVATAMAIIMKYHNWPEQGHGKHMNFFDNNLKFDYENYKPNWKLLPQKIEISNISEEEQVEVSTLCLSAGIAIDTYYNVNESGADILFLGNVMSSRFNFAPTKTLSRDDYKLSEWVDIIKREVDNNRPLLYYGNGSIGHLFVIDGYSDDGDFHINWGWDGISNGYFRLPDISVDGMDFSQNQKMIIGIEPNRTDLRYSSFMVNDGIGVLNDIKNDGFNFTVDQIKTNESFGAVLPCVYGDVDNSGLIGLALLDSQNNIIELVGYYAGKNNPSSDYLNIDGISHQLGFGCEQIWRFECGNYKSQKNLYVYNLHNLKIDSEIKSGYKLQMIGRDTPDSEWEIILGTSEIPTAIDLQSEVRSEWRDIVFDYDPALIEILGLDDFACGTKKALKDGIVRFLIYSGGAGSVKAECGPNVTFHDQDYFVDTGHFETSRSEVAFYVGDGNFCKLFVEEKSTNYTDKSLQENEIECNGIIYSICDKVLGEYAPNTYAYVVGYTDNCGESIKIEESVMINGREYPVKAIVPGAFKDCDIIRYVDFSDSELDMLDSSLSFLNNIESITVDSEKDPKVGSNLLHHSSILKSVYEMGVFNMTYGPDNLQISEFLSAAAADEFKKHDIFPDWYISSPVKLLKNPQEMLYYPGDIMQLAPPRYYVPGKFRNAYGSPIGDNVFEMWQYELDHDGRQVYIKPLIEGLEIDQVLINGMEATCDNYIYNSPITVETADLKNDDVDVEVDYTLHGYQAMSTHYSVDFNAGIERKAFDELFSGVKDIPCLGAERNVRIYNTIGILVFEGIYTEAKLHKGLYIVETDDKAFKHFIK